MKQNVRKTDNRDLMAKLFDRGINVQGIAQSLYPELSQFQIRQMMCASGPYTKEDRNLLAQKIYNMWKAEVSKPDYRLGESKNVKHINESQLKSIISESVKKVLNENDNRDYQKGDRVIYRIRNSNSEPYIYHIGTINGYDTLRAGYPDEEVTYSIDMHRLIHSQDILPVDTLDSIFPKRKQYSYLDGWRETN